jgi:hypothetical protein
VEELLLSTIKCPAGGDIRQTEIQKAEPFVLEPSISEVEVAIGKLKSISRQVLIRFQLN